MNQQRTLITPFWKFFGSFRFPLLFSILSLYTGCIPDPHTSTRSPEIDGRVLDAHTHAPIEGAKIFFPDHPDVSCKSDAAGYFRLKPTHNFHLGGYPPEGDWPSRKFYGARVAISHPNYLSYVPTSPDDDWAHKGDIFLEPK